MRKAYDKQQRFGCTPIGELELNCDCRDEMIPVLAGLQHIYRTGELRRKVVQLIAKDINREARRDVGRPGLDDWQIVVLATVRLGCNYDYDKLQDQAENHRALRIVLGLTDWEVGPSFRARRIRDTLCQLSPSTLEAINHAIVSHGQTFDETAAEKVRVDSFVVETNIHFPSESTLIHDGMRKLIPVSVKLASLLRETGWRQSQCLLRKIKRLVRKIGKIGVSKSQKTKKKLKPAYQELLNQALDILNRANRLLERADGSPKTLVLAEQLKHWVDSTRKVCGVAYRRVILGEKVPNEDKLFSLFEPHTQLYRRGKAQSPIQLGRQLLIVEDGLGFVSHYHLMNRKKNDPDVVDDQMREAQRKHGNQIQSASFDRGFYSEKNARSLKTFLKSPCLPPTHASQYNQWSKEASSESREARKHHSGVESCIGAIQAGNGLKRCRDRTEIGFERYLGLAILGRNVHVLGKQLIARRDEQSQAAFSQRKVA